MWGGRNIFRPYGVAPWYTSSHDRHDPIHAYRVHHDPIYAYRRGGPAWSPFFHAALRVPLALHRGWADTQVCPYGGAVSVWAGGVGTVLAPCWDGVGAKNFSPLRRCALESIIAHARHDPIHAYRAHRDPIHAYHARHDPIHTYRRGGPAWPPFFHATLRVPLALHRGWADT